MATASEERLAFMRSLGITDDDVLDPSLVVKKPSNNRSNENYLNDKANRNIPLDTDVCNTSKAVFLNAEVLDTKAKPLQKEKASRRVAKIGESTSAPSPEQLKNEGNRAFEAGRYREALVCYTEAIGFIEEDIFKSREEWHSSNNGGGGNLTSGLSLGDSRITLLAALFSNRSACYLQAAKQIGAAEALESAMRDADRAVELRPVWFKGYSRQGDAFFKMRRYVQAAEAYEMALQFDPGNTNLLQSVGEARQRSLAEACESIHVSKRQAVSTRAGGNAASDVIASVAVPVPTDVSFSNGSNFGQDGGQLKITARQLWNEFKPEVEASVQQPTGDDYRREQLRLYREQKERKENCSTSVSGRDSRRKVEIPLQEDEKRPNISKNGEPTGVAPFVRKRQECIPPEFSSDAAAAYQQRLLEEYRRKKAQHL